MTPEEICRHINRCNDLAFIQALALWLNVDTPQKLSVGERKSIHSPGRDITVTLSTMVGNEVVLEKVVFGPLSTLPYALDIKGETSETACLRLGDNFATGRDRRISWFMEEALVVELTFLPGGVGLDRVRVARLGAPI